MFSLRRKTVLSGAFHKELPSSVVLCIYKWMDAVQITQSTSFATHSAFWNLPLCVCRLQIPISPDKPFRVMTNGSQRKAASTYSSAYLCHCCVVLLGCKVSKTSEAIETNYRRHHEIAVRMKGKRSKEMHISPSLKPTGKTKHNKPLRLEKDWLAFSSRQVSY